MTTYTVIFTGLKGPTMSPFIHEVKVIVDKSEDHREVIRGVLKDLGYTDINILTIKGESHENA